MGYYRDHMCTLFISDYWGEFCKSSFKLPQQKQIGKKFKDPQSINQRDLRRETGGCWRRSAHMMRPAVMSSRDKLIPFASTEHPLFFSSSDFCYLEHNHKLGALGQRRGAILYQSRGKKRVCSAKTHILITPNRDKDKRHQHKTDSGFFFSPAKMIKAWKCLI